jgi:hypothetical protein
MASIAMILPSTTVKPMTAIGRPRTVMTAPAAPFSHRRAARTCRGGRTRAAWPVRGCRGSGGPPARIGTAPTVPAFNQRFFGKISADGKTIAGRWERGMGDAGNEWEIDFPINYFRK